jgi:hypothetical protein
LDPLVFEREKRPRVSHRKAAPGDLGANLLGQLQQAHVICDRRAVLADSSRDLLLRQAEFAAQPFVGGRLIDRIQVFALDVLDERHLEKLAGLAAPNILDDDGHPGEPCALGSAPAALARDDAIAAIDLPHHDGLDDAVCLDRLCELVEARVLESMPRLVVARRDLVDVDVHRAATRTHVRHIRDERAEPFAKRRSFFHKSSQLRLNAETRSRKDL